MEIYTFIEFFGENLGLEIYAAAFCLLCILAIGWIRRPF